MLFTRYECPCVRVAVCSKWVLCNWVNTTLIQSSVTLKCFSRCFVLRLMNLWKAHFIVFMLFYPQLPSQYSSAPAPKPSAPPPTAPKPALSFLPPPEMGDRPPPAPWAEELKARTNRQVNHNSAPNSAAQPFSKGPAVAPKSGVGARMGSSSASLAQKLNQNLNQIPTPVSVAPKPSPPSVTSSFPPPPAAPPAPPVPPSNMSSPPASNHVKSSPFASQANANQKPPAAVPPPQPKTMASPPSSFNHPMKSPPVSSVRCNFISFTKRLYLHCINSRKDQEVQVNKTTDENHAFLVMH